MPFASLLSSGYGMSASRSWRSASVFGHPLVFQLGMAALVSAYACGLRDPAMAGNAYKPRTTPRVSLPKPRQLQLGWFASPSPPHTFPPEPSSESFTGRALPAKDDLLTSIYAFTIVRI